VHRIAWEADEVDAYDARSVAGEEIEDAASGDAANFDAGAHVFETGPHFFQQPICLRETGDGKGAGWFVFEVGPKQARTGHVFGGERNVHVLFDLGAGDGDALRSTANERNMMSRSSPWKR